MTDIARLPLQLLQDNNVLNKAIGLKTSGNNSNSQKEMSEQSGKIDNKETNFQSAYRALSQGYIKYPAYDFF